MKLRNKKTGEIMDDVQYRNYSTSDGFGLRMDGKEWEYHSLAELNEEWEDYEELEYWYIDSNGDILFSDLDDDKLWKDLAEERKQIGNYFETKEEAEKATEKLKAWKRLKDKGFDFVGCFKDNTINYEFVERPLDYDEAEEAEQDLAFLFGGEE